MAERHVFINKMMDKGRPRGFEEAKLPGTRWQVFKALLTQRFSKLVKVNLLMLLFALPAIALVYVISMFKAADLSLLQYFPNAWAGYPFFDDVAVQEYKIIFSYNNILALGIIPAFIIAGLGIAGGFNVIRQMAWGEDVPIWKQFFKGIKINFWQSMLGMFITGITLGLVIVSFSAPPVLDIKPVWSVIWQVASVLLFAAALLFTMFFITQSGTYKQKTDELIRNSFIFSIGMPLQNILFMAASLIPLAFILLMGSNQLVFMIAIFIIGLFGLSFMVLVWTVHTQYAYDKFINGREEAAGDTDEDLYERHDLLSPAALPADAAGVKRVSGIDGGKPFTPLSENYSRAELNRMLREREGLAADAQRETEGVRKPAGSGAAAKSGKNGKNKKKHR